MIKTIFSLFITTSLLLASFQVHSAASNKKNFKSKSKKNASVIRSEAGLKIPEWGISIDAIYNPQLTDIIPGYHIVNVVLSNHRGSPIRLDPKNDKWIIVDNAGKKHRTYNHVKQFDVEIWNKLPKNLKMLLDYPKTLHPGKSTTIDVFISSKTELFNFREIKWKSAHFGKEFDMLTDYEQNLSVVKNPKEFKTPSKSINADDLTNAKSLVKPELILQQDPQADFIKSKYRNDPKINSIAENQKTKKNEPLFDSTLDDMIIMD